MSVQRWPSILGAKGVSFTKRGMSVLGPVSLSGRTQAGQNDAGFWMAAYSRVPAAGPARVKAYRRLSASLEGAAHQVLVPVFDVANAPWPTPGTYGGTSDFTDGTEFSDDTEFADKAIVASVAVSAAKRANVIEVTESSIAEVEGGELFSIRNHLYVISEVVSDGLWRIWPPLREAATAGDEVNFDRPHCLMRLIDDSADDLTLDMGRVGFPDMQFVETLPEEDNSEVDEAVSCLPTTRILAITGDVTLTADEVDELRINNTSGAARQITLPDPAERGRRHLRIIDHGHNSGTYNITLVVTGGKTIMGGSSYILDNHGSSIELSPVPDGSGYD